MIDILICFSVPLIFLVQYLTHLQMPLGWEHNDAFQMQFLLKHYFDIFQTGNWKNILELPMYYGVPQMLLYNEHFALHAVFAFPIYLITHNITITYNVLVIGVIMVSFGAMYALVKHVTGNRWGSTIAAIIYTFNPYIFARFPDHLNLITLCFFPLIFLFFEKSLQRQTNTSIFLFFLAIAGQMLTSWYYVGFLAVVLPIYVVWRLLQVRVPLKKFLRPGFFIGCAVCLLVFGITYALYAPFLMNGTSDAVEDTQYQTFFSAWPSDWLLTTKNNLLYGGVRDFVTKIAPTFVHTGNPSEQNMFIGITPFILCLLALLFARRDQHAKYFWPMMGIGGLSFLLSFGPRINIHSDLSFPGLFGVLHRWYLPVSSLRVPSRFAMVVFFAAAVAGGYATTNIIARAKRRPWLVGALLVLLILVEYWSIPPSTRTMPLVAPIVYSTLEKLPVQVLLEYPISNRLAPTDPRRRIEYLDAHYLWYRTMYHTKYLLNGYSAFTPGDAQERANYIAAGFPSPDTLQDLKMWGVGAIILHRDELNQPDDYRYLKTALRALGVRLVIERDGLALYDLTALGKGK